MRALFFGTPEFAVPCLRALADIADVQAVVCQPDKPVGRGLALAAPPTKVVAEELGIPVHQPTKLRTGEFAEWVRAANVDVALVVAYGRILPQDVLDGPRLGCVNVHASLLPKYRGAAPITWAVVNGERESGVTLMKMDIGMDTGDALERFAVPILPDDTAGDLSRRLSDLGALAVRRGLPKYIAGGYTPEQQNHSEATMARLLEKNDGRIVWSASAAAVHNHVRGMSPWPGAFTKLASETGKTVKIHRTACVPATSGAASGVPGTVERADKHGVFVCTGNGLVELIDVQLEGKKPMAARDWAAGRGIAAGQILI